MEVSGGDGGMVYDGVWLCAEMWSVGRVVRWVAVGVQRRATACCGVLHMWLVAMCGRVCWGVAVYGGWPAWQ